MGWSVDHQNVQRKVTRSGANFNLSWAGHLVAHFGPENLGHASPAPPTGAAQITPLQITQ